MNADSEPVSWYNNLAIISSHCHCCPLWYHHTIWGSFNKFQDCSHKTTTVNHTILTIMLHFNMVSLQFNTAFPSFC